jgi:hypothetical protein
MKSKLSKKARVFSREFKAKVAQRILNAGIGAERRNRHVKSSASKGRPSFGGSAIQREVASNSDLASTRSFRLQLAKDPHRPVTPKTSRRSLCLLKAARDLFSIPLSGFHHQASKLHRQR